jgi:hypothetical protein
MDKEAGEMDVLNLQRIAVERVVEIAVPPPQHETAIIRYNHILYTAYCYNPVFAMEMRRLVYFVMALMETAKTYRLNDMRLKVFGQSGLLKTHILSYLDSTSLCAADTTCTHFNTVVRENKEEMWTVLCQSDFAVVPQSIKPRGERGKEAEPLKAKDLYIELHKKMRMIVKPEMSSAPPSIRGSFVNRNLLRF